jgi:hypothetical protein
MRRNSSEINAPAPEKYFNFLGLIIVRKADILAATAFILAAASAAYQAEGYIAGAHLSIFAPANVLIFFDQYSDGEIVTRVAGQLTFTNSGQQGRDGTVREVWVDLTGLDFKMRQYWSSFPKAKRDGELLKIDQVDDAFPLQVPGGGTLSKLTGFAPRVQPCIVADNCERAKQYVSDTTFLELLSAHIDGFLTLTFQAKTYQSGSVTPSTCKIEITKELMTYLAANDWYMVRCAPEQT